MEFKRLIRMALPIAVASFFSYTFGPVSIAFCGRLGKTELATIGLAMSIFNMAGLFATSGLLTASDTMFSQTYGSKMRYKISIQLKRSLAVITICCIPCCALYMCIEPVLLILGQNPQISQLTSGFLLRLIPALFFAAWGQVLTRYVQNQNHLYAPLLFNMLTNGVNALLHYIFLFQLHMGLNGSAFAQTMAYLFQAVCFFIYICFSKKIVKFNAENTCEFLEDWGSWLRLAIPGLVMVSLESTLFELGGLVAGEFSAGKCLPFARSRYSE
ncbi:unnamed protein product [Dicrocoelium dendriticum]|nr:unnamed protein product [Dicrocoelium dendriticum]